MIKGYSKERLEILELLARDSENFLAGRFWTLEPRTLRFHHGESLAELKIPYHLGGEDEGIVERAVVSIALLLKKRAEETKDSGDLASAGAPQPIGGTGVAAGNDFEFAHPLRESTWKTAILLPESLEKKVAEEILRSVPLIDGAILANWLGPDGHGRDFIQWVQNLIEKTLRDEAGLDDPERTSYLALLAIIKCVLGVKEKLKTLRVKGVSYEKLDLSVGFVLFEAVRVSLDDLLVTLESAGAPYYNNTTAIILKSATVPAPFLSIKSSLLSSSYNPYGIPKNIFDALALKLGGDDGIMDSSPESMVKAGKLVRKDKALLDMLREQYAVTKVRELTLSYLMEFDMPGVGVHKELGDICQEDRLIKNLLIDEKLSNRVREGLGKIKLNYSKDKPRVEAIIAIEAILSSMEKGKKKWFGGDANKGISTEDAVDEMLTSYFACSFDMFVEKFTEPMRTHLADRRGELEEGIIQEEYNRGRLYRFSVDKRAIIISLKVEQEGQLFIDMKDFTKKTLKVKEIAMAEFMRENFYTPIIEAASKYGTSTGVQSMEKGMKLNSLPGDAAIFSGGVSSLVSLALDMQKITADYRDKLTKRLPPVKGEMLLTDINKRFESAKLKFKQRRKSMEAAIKSGDDSAKQKLKLIVAEEHRLESVYRDEVETAVSGEMEAGLFISFGVKAETMLVEGKEGFCTPVTVAIGEKINEAARGTNRDSMVRAKQEMRLERERLKRKEPELRYPFEVFVDKIYRLRMPSELSDQVDELVEHKKEVDLKAIAQLVANECYADLKKLSENAPSTELRIFESSSDIYNRGQAISDEALKAYRRESKATTFFFQKSVRPGALHESIRKAFYFPMDILEFWFGYEAREGVETISAFILIGEVVFKGFEAKKPTVVYEMLDVNADFFKGLKKHHFVEWLETAKNKKGDDMLDE
jgi:hypothetical protein